MPWILVTGAAKRLGREIALDLAKHQHDVVIHYNKSKEEAKETLRLCQSFGVKAEMIQGDFNFLSSFIDNYLKKYPETKGLINNVGSFHTGLLSETSQHTWSELLQTNLEAPFLLTKALLPTLKRNQGKVINIGTVGLHSQRGNTMCPAYAVIKSSLWHLTLSLAKELVPFGVTVNMVSPGVLDFSCDLKDTYSLLPSKNPISSYEVARIVTFLIDEKSKNITGQNIEISGGFGL